MKVLFLELNEVNFDHLRFFAEQGQLPHLAGLIKQHGVSETTSESSYEELEPWIQWVTAHTGLPFAEHGVFRLGDIAQTDFVQIWEVLEEAGLRVGAICPMNAKNRTREAAFFVPDPWTSTRLTGRPLLRRLYQAVSQAVNDNAQSQLSAKSVFWLALGAMRYARPESYHRYLSLAMARRKPWTKAILLDLLLAEVFIREVKRSRPNFSSLFLNAAAHIQHHYMFNSRAYDGRRQNPPWYVPPEQDPVAEIYQLYDYIVGQIRRSFPDVRLMIATGLHQEPHTKVTFYWRLKNHAAYLKKIGVPFANVSARMSRDFVVECDNEQQARIAAEVLASAKDAFGQPLFEVDNRGRSLFAMLTWSNDIDQAFAYTVNGTRFEALREDVAFVAIKNGEHHGTGYFMDTGSQIGAAGSFPLAQIPERICEAFGIRWPRAPEVLERWAS